MHSLDKPIQVGGQTKSCFYQAPIPWIPSSHPPSQICMSFTASIFRSSYSFSLPRQCFILSFQARISIICLAIVSSASIYTIPPSHHPITCSHWVASPRCQPATFLAQARFTCQSLWPLSSLHLLFRLWLKSGDPAASRSLCTINISSVLPLPNSSPSSYLCPQHSLFFSRIFTWPSELLTESHSHSLL